MENSICTEQKAMHTTKKLKIPNTKCSDINTSLHFYKLILQHLLKLLKTIALKLCLMFHFFTSQQNFLVVMARPKIYIYIYIYIVNVFQNSTPRDSEKT